METLRTIAIWAMILLIVVTVMIARWVYVGVMFIWRTLQHYLLFDNHHMEL